MKKHLLGKQLYFFRELIKEVVMNRISKECSRYQSASVDHIGRNVFSSDDTVQKRFFVIYKMTNYIMTIKISLAFVPLKTFGIPMVWMCQPVVGCEHIVYRCMCLNKKSSAILHNSIWEEQVDPGWIELQWRTGWFFCASAFAVIINVLLIFSLCQLLCCFMLSPACRILNASPTPYLAHEYF